MNIIFMGTPTFAATILERLCQWCASHNSAHNSEHASKVVAVYCQPDRPAGRGHKLTPPPVKVLAQSLALPVFQPQSFKNPDDIARLAAFAPDALIVAAYGLLLPQAVLNIPTLAPVNVHASLLPLHRGAAPIQRAIMQGDKETGVSIMRMEATLDTGPVYATSSLPIGEHTAGTLHDALAVLGAEALLDVLKQFRNPASGRADPAPTKNNNADFVYSVGAVSARPHLAGPRPTPQDHSRATHAPKLTKACGRIDWNRPAQTVHNHIKAVTPWPGARCFLEQNGEQVPLILAPGTVGYVCSRYFSQITPQVWPENRSYMAGQWVRLPSGDIAVTTADRLYVLTTVRPENRKNMPARDFAHGYTIKCFT